MSKPMTETAVVCAAICLGGKVYQLPRPARHHDVIRHMREAGIDAGDIAIGEQGFVSTEGRFLHRFAAQRVAREAGQIIRETAPAHGLFSEDVW
jgi:hypothetical protein